MLIYSSLVETLKYARKIDDRKNRFASGLLSGFLLAHAVF